MAGKEETPKCRKKTVTRTNEMIEDLIDFIEIHLEMLSRRSIFIFNNTVCVYINDDVYSIQHYRYNWNIVESAVNHHKSNQQGRNYHWGK
jgi:hypothetical protein